MRTEVKSFHLPSHASTLALPKGARVLSVCDQFGKFKLFAAIDPEQKRYECRDFIIVATGMAGEDESTHLRFINSFHVHNGISVWHAFEVLKYGEQSTQFCNRLSEENRTAT